jgi:hypothetical protein
MPATYDIIDRHGHRFRLRRAKGFAAAQAKWAWAQVAGQQGAHILALGAAQVAEITSKLATDRQREAFAAMGELDARRALIMLAVVTCMDRGRLTPHDMSVLVNHFVCGWVDIEVADAEGKRWLAIDSTDTLDAVLDGSSDGDIWNSILWEQIAHCLGPTTGGAGT